MSVLPKTIPYHIFGEIRHRIIRGEYLPGAALREQELEKEFGSSRGPIREGLRLLELRGLTVHAPRRGFRVRSLSPDELADLYSLRVTLECLVIKSLKKNMPTRTISELRESLHLMEFQVKEGNIEKYFEENVRFHDIMIKAANNTSLTMVLDIVNEMSLPVRYHVMSKRFSELKSIAFHREITDALAGRDFARAERLTRDHILGNHDFVIRISAEIDLEAQSGT